MTAPLPTPAPSHLPTEGQIAEFYERGLIVIPAVFTPAEVRRLAAAFDRLRRTAAELRLRGHAAGGAVEHQGAHYVLDERAIRRVVWCSAADPVLDRFGEDPRLLDIAGALLDATELDHLISQAHFKQPGDGVDFPFHQDSAHRRYGTPQWTDVDGRGSYVQTIVAIDEMSDENGALRWIPGSCQAGHLPPAPGVRTLPADAFDPAASVTAHLRPGDVAFFGPYTIHGSPPNPSKTRSRRAFINGFAPPGANHRQYPGHRPDGTGAGRRVVVPPAR